MDCYIAMTLMITVGHCVLQRSARRCSIWLSTIFEVYLARSKYDS